MLSRFIRSSSTYAHRICEMGKTLLANPRYISSSRTLYDDDWMGMVDDEEIEMLSTNFQSPFATPKPAEAAKKMADNLKEGKISAINDLEAKIALQAIAEKYKKYNFAFAVISAGCDADPQIRSLIEAAKSSSKPTIALILLHNVLYQSSSIGHYFAAFIKPDEIFLIDNNGREKYRRDLCEAPYPGPQEYNIAKEDIIAAMEKYSKLPVQTNEIPTFDKTGICGFAALSTILMMAKEKDPMRFLQRTDLLSKARAELFLTERIREMPELVEILEKYTDIPSSTFEVSAAKADTLMKDSRHIIE